MAGPTQSFRPPSSIARRWTLPAAVAVREKAGRKRSRPLGRTIRSFLAMWSSPSKTPNNSPNRGSALMASQSGPNSERQHLHRQLQLRPRSRLQLRRRLARLLQANALYARSARPFCRRDSVVGQKSNASDFTGLPVIRETSGGGIGAPGSRKRFVIG